MAKAHAGGLTASLDWVEVAPLGDVLVRAAARWPDKEALLFPDERRTYAHLLDGALGLARALAGIGASRGDRVGILMPNCFDFVELQFACAMLGVSSIPINARYKALELGHVIADSGCIAVATTDLVSEYVDLPGLLADAAASGPASLRHLILLDNGGGAPAGFLDRAGLLAAGNDVAIDVVHEARRRVRLRDEAVLMYTSGTTANPKGCVLTHEALVRTGLAAADRWQLSHDERFWNPLPLFHMGGIFPLIAHFWVGATIFTETRFEPAMAIRRMQEERCTYSFSTFPTITQAIIKHPDFDQADLSTIRLVNDTGAPDTLRQVQERFPQASVVTLFGMTEACGGISWSAPDDPLDKRMETGGLPFRGTDVRIVAPETGAERPAGEVGEICFRGPGMFERYLNDPAKTAATLRDGWCHTGDLGRKDADGRLTFVGRLKDMLKVGGENVAAMEIEAFLQSHPAVKVAQVVGVPDEKYVEVAAAFVELNEGAAASADDLIAFCSGAIASFKVPRHIRFVQAWPMSASKIQKFRLRDGLLAELDATMAEDPSAAAR
ncbi:MAG: AMP-binding protein [Actinobacteria bacterium]|nr:AMP-binding protein [Actinomycetota bacterium]